MRTSTAPAFEWEPPAAYGRAYGDPNPRNQVTGEAGAPIVFDPSGAMVYDGATTYGYDLVDRLVSASGPLGTGAYLYDAQGRRDRRAINGTFTFFTQWSGEEEVGEYDADLSIRYRFVPGPGVDRKIAVVGVAGAPSTAQPTRYLHADAQGSVLAATTESGLIPRLTAYSPWGEVSGTPPDAFSGMAWGYAGRPHDPETGLVYVRARYYSPRLGQWLTPDPIGTDDDPNLYLYVGLDPVNGADPSGACQSCAFPNLRPRDDRDHLERAGHELIVEPIEAAERIASDVRNRREPSLSDAITVVGSVWVGRGRSIGEVAENVAGAVARSRPGRLGGARHRAVVEEVATDMEARGLTAEREHYVRMPDSPHARGRYVDVVGRDRQSGEIREYHQVGQSRRDGQPVARERRAIADIEQALGCVVSFSCYLRR